MVMQSLGDVALPAEQAVALETAALPLTTPRLIWHHWLTFPGSSVGRAGDC